MFIVLLILFLSLPFSAQSLIGQIYIRDSQATYNVLLLSNNEMKDKEIYSLEKLLNSSLIELSQLTANLEIDKLIEEKILTGKVALLLSDTSKTAITFNPVNKFPRGKSLIWKYLKKQDISSAFWFGNYEIINSDSRCSYLVDLILQNEKVKNIIKAQELAETEHTMATVFLPEEEIMILTQNDATLIKVVRNDKKDNEIYNFLRDSLSGLADSRARSSLFR